MEVERRTRCSSEQASAGRGCQAFEGRASTENKLTPCDIALSFGEGDESSQKTSATNVFHQNRTDNLEPPVVVLPSSSRCGLYSRGREVSGISHQSSRRDGESSTRKPVSRLPPDWWAGVVRLTE